MNVRNVGWRKNWESHQHMCRCGVVVNAQSHGHSFVKFKSGCRESGLDFVTSSVFELGMVQRQQHEMFVYPFIVDCQS